MRSGTAGAIAGVRGLSGNNGMTMPKPMNSPSAAPSTRRNTAFLVVATASTAGRRRGNCATAVLLMRVDSSGALPAPASACSRSTTASDTLV